MTEIIATIRWIDEHNAYSLGYFGYRTGTWVLEGDGDEWIADLGDLDDIAAVKRAAESHLGLASTTWRSLPGNYGPALELVDHR